MAWWIHHSVVSKIFYALVNLIQPKQTKALFKLNN